MTIKNKKSTFEFMKKYQNILGWILAFSILFSSRLKDDYWGTAFLSAAYLILVMALYQLFLNKVLRRYLVNKKAILYYTYSFLVLSFFVGFSTYLEVKLFRYLHEMGSIMVPLDFIDQKVFIFRHLQMVIFLLGTFAITTTAYLLRRERKSILEREELMRAKLEMELRYLKSQINPHFLFNSLNNIYSMVYSHDENAPESILILSEMLRYVTVDCQADKLSLEKEMKYIERYIDMQLMQMEKLPDITFEQDIQNPSFKIVPMILQPIIENCFKYSRIENHKNAFIRIQATQNSTDGFVFIAENSIAPTLSQGNDERKHGIGLVNIQKRLELLYGKKFEMHIENNLQIYRVELKIHE
jgi:sensor histidine kinase YesM